MKGMLVFSMPVTVNLDWLGAIQGSNGEHKAHMPQLALCYH